MRNLKFLALILISIAAFGKAEALDIEYSTTLSTKGSDMLIEYSSIGKKQNFICSTVSAKCTSTKKTTLGVSSSLSLKQSLKDELDAKHANHITLSPSRNYLAYYIDGTDSAPNRTYTIRDMRTDKEYTISSSTSYWDLVSDEGRVFDFSPDEKRLVYLDDREGTLALYMVDMTTLSNPAIASTKLATSAYQADDFFFTDNQTIYYVGNSVSNKYIWSLYRYNLATGKDAALETGVSYVDPLRKIGSAVVFNRLQTKGYGPEMYNTSTKKIIQFKVPNISTAKKTPTNEEIITVGAATGVLMTPTSKDMTKSFPLVIWLHGGPYRQTSYGYHPYHSYGIYDSILELLRKDNAVVFKLDYRGSFGFGRAYAEGIKGSVGKGDVDDVMAAIAYAKNRYHISGVYLAGNSYGGYLSLAAIAEHADALTGVMSINGVTDWESLLVRMQNSIFNTEFNGLPIDGNRALYDQASIYNKIQNIGNQPIKIIAGEADRTIPFWQATDLYAKLKAANKNVSLVSYKGEDHVYAGKKTIQDLCKQMFTFVGLPVDKDCSK